MKTVTLEAKNFEEIIFQTVSFLKKGKVLALPTDTVYGLVADAMNTDAIKKIFRIKTRLKEKALPIFVKDIASARRLAYISDEKAEFLERVWPGAVSAVFHHKGKLPKILTGNLETLALRMPDHKFLKEVLDKMDVPLAQTSANISGMPPAKNTKEIEHYFAKEKERPDLIIYAGEISSEPSMLVDLTKNSPIVLRSGIMTRGELDQLLRRF